MLEFIKNNSTYICVLLGVFAGWPLLWKYRDKIKCNSIWLMLGLCFLYAFFGVLGVLVFGGLESIVYGNGWIWGATSSYGLYLIRPLFLFLVFGFSKNRRGFLDLYAFYVLPSLFIQRIRCLINGCCYGSFIFNTSLRWPVREAEMIFFVIMLFVMMKKVTQTKDGGLLPYWITSYGVFRFICECFRGDNGNGIFHLPHIWSVIAIIIGLAIYSEYKKK